MFKHCFFCFFLFLDYFNNYTFELPLLKLLFSRIQLCCLFPVPQHSFSLVTGCHTKKVVRNCHPRFRNPGIKTCHQTRRTQQGLCFKLSITTQFSVIGVYIVARATEGPWTRHNPISPGPLLPIHLHDMPISLSRNVSINPRTHPPAHPYDLE